MWLIEEECTVLSTVENNIFLKKLIFCRITHQKQQLVLAINMLCIHL